MPNAPSDDVKVDTAQETPSGLSEKKADTPNQATSPEGIEHTNIAKPSDLPAGIETTNIAAMLDAKIAEGLAVFRIQLAIRDNQCFNQILASVGNLSKGINHPQVYQKALNEFISKYQDCLKKMEDQKKDILHAKLDIILHEIGYSLQVLFSSMIPWIITTPLVSLTINTGLALDPQKYPELANYKGTLDIFDLLHHRLQKLLGESNGLPDSYELFWITMYILCYFGLYMLLQSHKEDKKTNDGGPFDVYSKNYLYRDGLRLLKQYQTMKVDPKVPRIHELLVQLETLKSDIANSLQNKKNEGESIESMRKRFELLLQSLEQVMRGIETPEAKEQSSNTRSSKQNKNPLFKSSYPVKGVAAFTLAGMVATSSTVYLTTPKGGFSSTVDTVDERGPAIAALSKLFTTADQEENQTTPQDIDHTKAYLIREYLQENFPDITVSQLELLPGGLSLKGNDDVTINNDLDVVHFRLNATRELSSVDDGLQNFPQIYALDMATGQVNAESRSDYYKNLAIFYDKHQIKPAESLSAAKVAVQLDLRHADFFMKYYSSSKKHTEVVEVATKALEKDDRFIAAFIERGNAHFALNQFQQAIADVEKVLAIDSKNTDAIQFKQEVEQKIRSIKPSLVENKRPNNDIVITF